MTKILYVSTSTTVGGAEKTLNTLATSIDHKEFEVVGVVSVKPKAFYADRLEKAGFPVYSLDAPGLPTPNTLLKLASIIRKTRPDIVHAVMYKAIQLCRAVKTLHLARFKLLSSPRVSYRTRSAGSLRIDRLLRSADDLLVSESHASRSYLVDTLGYAPKKVTAIHNGIDFSRLSPSSADRSRLRLELKIADNEILLGTVGRLDLQKGHAYLLEAVAKLRPLYPVHCVIIGSGELKAKLEELARFLRIETIVHFVGEQYDVVPWLSAMDVFILPSLWEGLPNALLEAMGMGLPVIATHIDGIPEAIQDGTSGLLCASQDSQAIYDTVQYLLLDPSLKKRLGTAAQGEMRARFQLDLMIEAYEKTYRKLVETA